MQSERRWAHVLRTVTLDKLLDFLEAQPSPARRKRSPLLPGGPPGLGRRRPLGWEPRPWLLTQRAFNLRGLGHRPARTGVPPGRCEVLDRHLESPRVGAGVDGHEVMPHAKRRLVNGSARARVQIGFREVRGAPRRSAHPAGLLACLLCVLGVSFLYWLVYRCLIRCELLPRRL